MKKDNLLVPYIYYRSDNGIRTDMWVIIVYQNRMSSLMKIIAIGMKTDYRKGGSVFQFQCIK